MGMKPYRLDLLRNIPADRDIHLEFLDPRSAAYTIRSARIKENTPVFLVLIVNGLFSDETRAHIFRKSAYNVTWRLWPAIPKLGEKEAAQWNTNPKAPV